MQTSCLHSVSFCQSAQILTGPGLARKAPLPFPGTFRLDAENTLRQPPPCAVTVLIPQQAGPRRPLLWEPRLPWALRSLWAGGRAGLPVTLPAHSPQDLLPPLLTCRAPHTQGLTAQTSLQGRIDPPPGLQVHLTGGQR